MSSEQPTEYVIPATLLEDVKTCIRVGCDGTLPNEGELLRAIVKYARPHTSAPAPAACSPKCDLFGECSPSDKRACRKDNANTSAPASDTEHPHEKCHECPIFFKCEQLPPCASHTSAPAPAGDYNESALVKLMQDEYDRGAKAAREQDRKNGFDPTTTSCPNSCLCPLCKKETDCETPCELYTVMAGDCNECIDEYRPRCERRMNQLRSQQEAEQPKEQPR